MNLVPERDRRKGEERDLTAFTCGMNDIRFCFGSNVDRLDTAAKDQKP